MLPKLLIIWLSNLSILSVPDVVCTKLDNFAFIMLPRQRVGEGGILIYSCPLVRPSGRPFVRAVVRPDIDTWFVRLSPSTVLELQLFFYIGCLST